MTFYTLWGCAWPCLWLLRVACLVLVISQECRALAPFAVQAARPQQMLLQCLCEITATLCHWLERSALAGNEGTCCLSLQTPSCSCRLVGPQAWPVTDKLYAALHQVAQQLCGSHVMEAAFTIMPSPLAVTHGFSAQQLMNYASEQQAYCHLVLLHWTSCCSAQCSLAGHSGAAVKSQMGCCQAAAPCPSRQGTLQRALEQDAAAQLHPAQVCFVCQQYAHTSKRSQWPSPPDDARLSLQRRSA